MDEPADRLIDDIREEVRERLLDGFENDLQVVQSATFAVALLHATDMSHHRPLIERITAEMAAEHRAAQAAWPTTTDCDRLDAAFAALRRQGIAARQRFEADRAGG